MRLRPTAATQQPAILDGRAQLNGPGRMVVDEFLDAVYAHDDLVAGIPFFKRVRRNRLAGHSSELSNSNEKDVGLRGRVRVLTQANRVAIPKEARPILKRLDNFPGLVDTDGAFLK